MRDRSDTKTTKRIAQAAEAAHEGRRSRKAIEGDPKAREAMRSKGGRSGKR